MRATKRVRDLANVTYERGFQELGLLSLGTRSLQGEVKTAFKYVKGCYQEEKNQMFSIPSEEKPWA